MRVLRAQRLGGAASPGPRQLRPGFCLVSVMDESTAQGRSPAEVARDVLAAVGQRKKDVVLAGLAPSLAVYLRTLAPGLFFSLMASRARKERKSKHC